MVKTYSMNKKYAQDHVPHTCEFCQEERPATYWSQNEEGWKPLGPSVFHCQAHRDKARKAAQERKR